MIDELKAKLEQATLRGDSLERVLDGAQESIAHHQSRIDELELYLSTSQDQYKDAARVIEEMRFVIDSRDDRVKELEAQLARSNACIERQIEELQRLRNGIGGWVKDMTSEQLAAKLDGVEAGGIKVSHVKLHYHKDVVVVSKSKGWGELWVASTDHLDHCRAVCRAAGDVVIEGAANKTGDLIRSIEQAHEAAGSAPLAGKWRHASEILCCGTLRIAMEDFDTNPTFEFRNEIMDWICATLNAAQNATRLREAANQAVNNESVTCSKPYAEMNALIDELWELSTRQGIGGDKSEGRKTTETQLRSGVLCGYVP